MVGLDHPGSDRRDLARGLIVADLLEHEAGVDIIAVLAIGGALLLGESLTAAVIAVMLATGDWLERYADGRGHRELSALISRAPRIVHRHEGGEIVDHPIAEVEVGDRSWSSRARSCRWMAP